MPEDPVSLAVIDPELTDLEQAGEADAPIATDEAHGDEGSTSASGAAAGKKTKKRGKGIVRGSTADYRRKEANRLAAERSRSRQSERRAGLDAAFKKLSEDNARLADEIARLERTGDGDGATQDRLAEAVSALQTPDQHGDRDTTMQADEGVGHDIMDAEAEAQAHSRTILAALMSDAEINQALGDNWMDHVDDSEVAAPEQSAPHEVEQDNAILMQPDANPDDSADKPELLPQQQVSSTPVAQALGQSEADTVASSQRQNAFAVALHAEMERHLRDDLAATKAAIDQIDKELSALRGESQGAYTAYVSSLPTDYISSDPAALASVLALLDHEMSGVSERMVTYKVEAARLRDSRLSEAQRLQNLLDGISAEGEDAEALEKILKPLQSHVADIINNLTSEESASFASLPGSRMAPAIAPRRRGRPPRSQAAGRPITKSSGGRKSKLRKQIQPEQNNDVEVDRESASRTPAAQNATQDEPVDLPDNDDPLAASQAETTAVEENDLVEPDIELSQLPEGHTELTTEEIISQLTHDEQDLHDLLRSHAEAEYEAQMQAQAEGVSLPKSFDNLGDSSNIDASSSSNVDPTLSQTLDDAAFGSGPRGSCDICQRTQTTVWRRIHLPDRELHVCNPCGMYHIKTGQIRPRELWGDGKLIRKRRKSTHPRPRKSDAKRIKLDGEGNEQPDDGTEHDQGTLDDHADGGLTVDNLGDVVETDEFRATLGIEGLGEIITGFGHQSAEEVAAEVANVFGNVE